MLLFIVLASSSILYWVIIPAKWRHKFLLAVSILTLYALQPQSQVNNLNFVLPTATLLLAIGTWQLVFQAGPVNRGQLRSKLAIPLVLVVLILVAPQASMLIGLVRDVLFQGVQQAVAILVTFGVLVGISAVTIPPQQRLRPYLLAAASLLVLLLLVRQASLNLASPAELVGTLSQNAPQGTAGIFLFALVALSLAPTIAALAGITVRRRIAFIWLALMVGLLAVLKADSLGTAVSNQLRVESRMPAVLTSDLGWLGISYIIFRLAHVLLDFRSGKLAVQPSLGDFITYVIFFPSITSGPITRVEEITPQLTANVQMFKVDNLVVGLLRLIVGILKKFALADQLIPIIAGPTLYTGSNSTLSLWIMLYAFLFQLYLDFSGYSDMAIGLGLLFGIRLPENFDQPFLQPNLSLFWQSWHITLSAWFRYYWFNPLTRRLMKWHLRRHPNLIVLIAQTSTMVLIGLWHHASWNWLAWGVWHGIGLFAYKVLGDLNRTRFQSWIQTPWRARLLHTVNILLTFHYFLLSMVFISFPDINQGLRYFAALFGIHQ